MENIEEEVVKQGKPWKNVAYFENFCDADNKRIELLTENLDFSVKVKRLSSGVKNFVVKTRKKETN
jgi:hypothetical protein